ncbi:hypothetical protein V8F06_013232 [Rhypophila decipiens]
MIIAVVGRDEVKELKKLIEEKKKANKDNIAAEIVVTSPNHLQKKIDSLAKAGHKIPALHLIVSSAIESIAYHISGLFRNVQIGPCVTGQPNALRMGATRHIATSGPTLGTTDLHIFWKVDAASITKKAATGISAALLNPSLVSLPSLEEKELAKAMDQCAEVREKHMRGSSPNGGGLQEKDDTPGWLTHWKAILGTAVSAVAAAGFFAVFDGTWS